MIKFCVVFVGLFALSGAHSWMSCPPSLDPRGSRGGNTIGPCEKGGGGPTTTVKAGDRLKVGWTSNNHAGGWVRLALVPHGKHRVFQHFEQNVLKVVCYGHDERHGETTNCDCTHPCNAREGCKYQSNKYDVHRYDTTVKIPYNLPAGVYILQWMSAMGNHGWFYYSCAKLQISGGNPSLSCKQTGPAPVAYGCMEGTAMSLNRYNNKKMGDFCFAEDGLGDQDGDMRRVPVNPECDSRITCQLSTDYEGCRAADNRMKDIKGGKLVCKGEIVPPPEPTCEDGIRNNGEDMKDCGGPNCDSCYELPTEPVDTRVYTDMDYNEHVEGGRISIRVSLRITKPVPNWRFTIFLTRPATFGQWSYWGCSLVSVNEFDTIWTFGPAAWNRVLNAGQTLTLGFNGKVTHLYEEPPRTVTKTFKVPED